MYNFEFQNPTRIIFGKDTLKTIDKYVPANARVLITFGGGSAKRSGLIDKVKAMLGSRTIFEFGGIEPNPRFETLVKASEVVRRESINFVLAVGGGSTIDGTKFIVLAAAYNGDAADLLKKGFSPIGSDMVKDVIPFGAVLTLPATGSEMNNGAVVSYQHGKFPVKSSFTYPVFSVLDPV
ncbi:MAG: iron-containing alcohol dehydrogenase, partial [Chloroflexota bacterium]